jgi:putative glycosyltransferase (TIGR04348 family)
MQIRFLVPGTETARNGNIVTSERWRSIMEELGHRVFIDRDFCAAPCDLFVVFNAYRNRPAIIEAVRRRIVGSVVICLTGTDLYLDFQKDPAAVDVLRLADRLVVLQPMALLQLPAEVLDMTHVIFQSAVRPPLIPVYAKDSFDVCVIAHLRDVKDPLRAAAAARFLPPDSRIRVLLVGRALTEDFAQAAEKEVRENKRFLWLGEQSGKNTAKILLQSRALVLSSLLEGGANVISEAIVSDVPVIVTRISCTEGLLGEDYPGFFPVGDTGRLAELLLRAESDHVYYNELRERCRREAYKFEPSLERESINKLLSSVAGMARGGSQSCLPEGKR